MKGLVLTLGAVVVGAAAGAVGVGSWNVLTATDLPEVEEHAEAPSTADTAAPGDAPEVDSGSSPQDPIDGAAVRTPAVEVDTPDEGAGPATGTAVPASGAGSAQRPPVETPPTPAAGSPAETDPQPDARMLENYQRLARIFAAMEPEEAAPVLSQLDDEQLEGILMAMQGRNAAPILAVMDPARVASISRRVLRGGS